MPKQSDNPILMQTEPYFYFLLDQQLTTKKAFDNSGIEDVLFFRHTTDPKLIVAAPLNDLIVIDLTNSVATSFNELKDEFEKAIYQVFLDRYGYTLYADEQDFPYLFRSRIKHEPRGYSRNPGDMSPFSGFSIYTKPKMIIDYHCFKSENRLQQVIDYVKKYGTLDIKTVAEQSLSETNENPKYVFQNMRNNLRYSCRLFNLNGIFMRPTKLVLEYNPKKATRQLGIVEKNERIREEKRKNQPAPALSYDDIRALYYHLLELVKLAMLGETLIERRQSRSQASTTRRCMALFPLIDAVFVDKPYRHMDSFIVVREHFLKMPKEEHKKYSHEFVLFFLDEVARHPRPPREHYNIFDIRKGAFIHHRYRKKFKYVQYERFPAFP